MNPSRSPHEILDTAKDQRELERAALNLAGSGAEPDLTLLEGYLSKAAFLQRLDTTSDPYVKTKRFENVVSRLGQNPSTRAGKVLLTLIESPEVTADKTRVEIILRAAPELKPMTAERVEVLRRVPKEIYMLSNLGLLFSNSSPLAVEEAARLVYTKPPVVADGSVVDIMHLNIVPHRTEVNLIRMAVSLVQGPISPIIRRGVFESFFDYHYDQWYEPMRNPPEPPAWNTAGPESWSAIIELAKLAAHSEISEPLKHKAAATAAEASQLLRGR